MFKNNYSTFRVKSQAYDLSSGLVISLSSIVTTMSLSFSCDINENDDQRTAAQRDTQLEFALTIDHLGKI